MRKFIKEKFWDIINYICTAGLFFGQVTIGFNFLLGQIAFVIIDIIVVVRRFATAADKSDKIKDCAMLAVAVGVLIIKLFEM